MLSSRKLETIFSSPFLLRDRSVLFWFFSCASCHLELRFNLRDYLCRELFCWEMFLCTLEREWHCSFLKESNVGFFHYPLRRETSLLFLFCFKRKSEFSEEIWLVDVGLLGRTTINCCVQFSFFFLLIFCYALMFLLDSWFCFIFSFVEL